MNEDFEKNNVTIEDPDMPKCLRVDTGVKDYQINNAVVEFNGTDYVFAEKLVNVFDKMDALQSKYQGGLSMKGADMWKACRAIDKDMRTAIDNLFEQPGVSDLIFGKCSCYALADGLPIWCNLLLAVMDEIDETILQQKQRTDPRLDAYLAKYKGREKA